MRLLLRLIKKTLKYFLLTVTTMSLLSCDTSKKITIIGDILLPQKKTSTYEFKYKTPSDGRLLLILRNAKNAYSNTPNYIYESCKKKGLENAKIPEAYKKPRDKRHKLYDSNGELTKRGGIYLDSARRVYAKQCRYTYRYGGLSITIKTENGSYTNTINTSTFAASRVRLGLALSRKNTVINSFYGPFKKGTTLVIKVTNIIEKGREYFTPPTKRQLGIVYFKG